MRSVRSRIAGVVCLIVGLILNRGHEGDHGCVRWKLERRKVAKLESKIKLHQGTWNYAHDFVFNIQKVSISIKKRHILWKMHIVGHENAALCANINRFYGPYWGKTYYPELHCQWIIKPLSTLIIQSRVRLCISVSNTKYFMILQLFGILNIHSTVTNTRTIFVFRNIFESDMS